MKRVIALSFITISILCNESVQALDRIERERFFELCNSVLSKNDVYLHETESGKTEKHWMKRESILNNPGRATIEGILDLSELQWSQPDKRKIAYILGTAYRESWYTMTPIREAKCNSDKCVVDAINKLMKKKPEKYKTNYALPLKENGKSYYGRGLVQITGPENYRRVGRAIGMDDQLYENPDLALDIDTAIKVIVVGMDRGVFTDGKHTLGMYFNDEKTDWINARKIVNGGSMDNAPITAFYAKKFMECLGKD